jgi:hypothetical protein
VRELNSLQTVRVARLPVRGSRLGPDQGVVHCADAGAASVHVGIADYLRRTRFDRVRIFRVEASGARRVATVEGSVVAFGPASAYVGRVGRGVTAVRLADARTRPVTDARFPELLAVSPDSARLALYDPSRQRLRVIDLDGDGRDRSLSIRHGWVLAWLGPDRLLFRKGGEGRVYDPDLRLLRRYPFFRADGQAQVGERLYGTDRYRLRALNLGSGRKRTVGELGDRGISHLVGLPERPTIEAGGRRPAAPVAQPVARRAALCRVLRAE